MLPTGHLGAEGGRLGQKRHLRSSSWKMLALLHCREGSLAVRRRHHCSAGARLVLHALFHPQTRQDTDALLLLVLMAEPHNDSSAACCSEDRGGPRYRARFEARSPQLESTPEPTLRSIITQFSLNMAEAAVHPHISLFSQQTHPAEPYLVSMLY